MSPRTPTGATRARILAYIRKRAAAGGTPPTIREIQHAMGLASPRSVQRHLQRLIEAGELIADPGKARGIRLPPVALSHAVPLAGRVQAGALTTAVEEIEGYLPVETPQPDATFALRVRGDSMRDAGILAGDIVVVRQQSTARNGDIVVALLEDEATIKRFRARSGNTIELQPENPDYTPIFADAHEVHILGKVIEVRRYLETTPLLERMP